MIGLQMSFSFTGSYEEFVPAIPNVRNELPTSQIERNTLALKHPAYMKKMTALCVWLIWHMESYSHKYLRRVGKFIRVEQIPVPRLVQR